MRRLIERCPDSVIADRSPGRHRLDRPPPERSGVEVKGARTARVLGRCWRCDPPPSSKGRFRRREAAQLIAAMTGHPARQARRRRKPTTPETSTGYPRPWSRLRTGPMWPVPSNEADRRRTQRLAAQGRRSPARGCGSVAASGVSSLTLNSGPPTTGTVVSEPCRLRPTHLSTDRVLRNLFDHRTVLTPLRFGSRPLRRPSFSTGRRPATTVCSTDVATDITGGTFFTTDGNRLPHVDRRPRMRLARPGARVSDRRVRPWAGFNRQFTSRRRHDRAAINRPEFRRRSVDDDVAYPFGTGGRHAAPFRCRLALRAIGTTGAEADPRPFARAASFLDREGSGQIRRRH